MASGDPFEIIHTAGSGTTFSYTTAAGVYLAITHVSGDNGVLHIQTFVGSTSGVGYFLNMDRNDSDGIRKCIIGNGQIMGNTAAVIDSYGLYLSGVEI